MIHLKMENKKYRILSHFEYRENVIRNMTVYNVLKEMKLNERNCEWIIMGDFNAHISAVY